MNIIILIYLWCWCYENLNILKIYFIKLIKFLLVFKNKKKKIIFWMDQVLTLSEKIMSTLYTTLISL